MSDEKLPEAGLYRTMFPHPTNADAIPARRLTYFSPVSDQGPPVLLIPDGREGRLWNFGKQGVLTEDAEWLSTLVPLKAQGYYSLNREVLFSAGQKLPPGLLVFLGYTQEGDAVVFPGVTMKDQNIAFAMDAIPLSDLQLDALTPVEFKLAQARDAQESTVH